jgi:hypothetical protein
MRLAPERFLVLLGLPLALLAAQTLESWRPKARGAFLAGALACGVLSMAGWAYVNGPWPGVFRDGGPFPHVRYGLMTESDFTAMKLLPPGRVAVLSAPELRVADMAAVRGGVSVLHGIGTMNISDRLYSETALAEAVLLKAEDEIAMARVVRDFAVDFLLVSGTAPPPDAGALCARLDALRWLEPVGPFTGSLYRVLPAHLPASARAGE